MNINHIELRHLRYFLAVAEELSFSRAAARLHISQPPLSKQIQDLEERLDVKLFERTKRKVSLTEAGHHLVPRAERWLRDLEEGLHSAQSVARGQVTELRIGTIYSAPLVPIFVTMIKRFRARYPTVRLVFREMLYAQLLSALAKNEVDVAFSWHIAPLADKRLRAQVISEDPLYLCLPYDHPLAKKRNLRVTDLANDLLFLTSLQAKMPFAQAIREKAQSQNISLAISQETSHFPVIANLVAGGCGIGVVPDYIARLATSELTCKELADVPKGFMRLPLALLYRADHVNAAVTALVAACGSSKRISSPPSPRRKSR
jgi:DNA-binding transcriptional LysR family regulator